MRYNRSDNAAMVKRLIPKTAPGLPYSGKDIPAKDIPESSVLADCLALLARHPKVAWAERMNTGATRLKGFHVRFGFPGLSDIIGQLKDGRFLAVECKKVGKLPSADQNKFLFTVNNANGFACWVDSDEKLSNLLGKL